MFKILLSALRSIGVFGLSLDGGGGGGGGTQTATSYTTNVPEYAQGPFMEMIGRGAALAEAPYQAYGGERVAQFTPMQQQAFQGMAGQQVAGQVGLGSGLAALSGISSFTQPGTAGQFMSPFMEQALAPQLRELSRQSEIQGTQQQAEATQRGAFGGSRDAIMRAERERNLTQQQGDVLARGYQTAFEQAQNQFNQEQANRLQAAGALGQLGQTQFGQQMDILGGQQRMGADQQAAVQRILDQQYADFREQRDFPYQQIGFMSDLLRGTGSSSRNIYTTPQPSGLQTIAGLGSAMYGASRMADGGEVKGYAVGGGITGLLGDQQLQKEVQTPRSPMMGLAAQEELADRSGVRQAAALQQPMVPDDTPPTVEELVQIRDMALAEGDLETAQEAQAMLDQMGAGVASLGEPDIPEGGIAMSSGGPVSFAEGQTVRSPYQRATFGTEWWEKELERLQDPEMMPPDSNDRNFWTYSSDVAAQRRRREQPPTKTPTMPGRSIGIGGPTAEQMQQFHAAQAKVSPDPTKEGLGALATAPGAASASSSVRGTGVAAPRMADFGFDADAEQRRLAEGQERVSAAERIARQGDIDAKKAEMEARGIYGEGREARIREGLAGIANDKDRAKGMAIMQAGLAILAADPAKGAWSAIGTGALQGLDAYKGDIEKLTARREGLLSKMDELEDIRRQEAVADSKELRELGSAYRRVEVEGAKAVQAIAKEIGINVKPKIAETVFREMNETARANAERASRERIAEQSVRTNQTNLRYTDLVHRQTEIGRQIERVRQNALEPYADFFSELSMSPSDPTLRAQAAEINRLADLEVQRYIKQSGAGESLAQIDAMLRNIAGTQGIGQDGFGSMRVRPKQ